MRGTRLAFLVTAAFCVCVCASVCYAHDLVPPSWRGSSGTTFQEWRFDTSANPAVPEVVSNPYASPLAQIVVGRYGSGWRLKYLSLGNQTGIWDLGQSGTMTIDVEDTPQIPAPTRRETCVQVTYYDDITAAPTVSVQGGEKLGESTQTVETIPTGGYWRLHWSRWTSQPTGGPEQIVITSDPQWMALVDQIVIDTRYVALSASVVQAKALPDETVCELSGPIVTRSFESCFYVEDATRAAGIRVNCATGQTPAARQTAPNVSGVIRTIGGERVIDQASVEPGGTGTVLPFGMNNRAVVSGLSPQGLLVRLWGHARVASLGGSAFVLDDGSPQGVNVELHGAAAPADGAYVAVTGVIGANTGTPVVRAGPGDTIVKAE